MSRVERFRFPEEFLINSGNYRRVRIPEKQVVEGFSLYSRIFPLDVLVPNPSYFETSNKRIANIALVARTGRNVGHDLAYCIFSTCIDTWIIAHQVDIVAGLCAIAFLERPAWIPTGPLKEYAENNKSCGQC